MSLLGSGGHAYKGLNLVIGTDLVPLFWVSNRNLDTFEIQTVFDCDPETNLLGQEVGIWET